LVGHARQFGLGAENKLALPREATNFPNNIVLRRLVLGLALRATLRNSSSVERGRDSDNDVGGKELGAKVGAHANAVLDLCLANLVDNGVDLERKVDILGGPVPHQLELAVWRDEADDAVAVELAQLHALVELAVLERHAAGGSLGSLAPHLVAAREAQQAVVVEQEAIIQAELALRGAAEVGAHNDLACNVGSQDSAGGAHEQVDILDDIHKRLVLAVFNVGFPPRYCARGVHGDLGRFLDGALRLDALGRDVHLESIGLGVLRVAKVDDFWLNVSWGRPHKRRARSSDIPSRSS
jgi:hypothetical protein